MPDIEKLLEAWFEKNFGSFAKGTELRAHLTMAFRELRMLVGLPPAAIPDEIAPPKTEDESNPSPQSGDNT